MVARGARGVGPRGWGVEIRHWLSKRREYAKSAPETESGLGPIDRVFTKCESCGQPIYEKELEARFNVCPHCEFHYPLAASERVRLLADANSFEERDAGMTAGDPLLFEGYKEKLSGSREKTGLDDAVLSGVATIGGHRVSLAAMDLTSLCILRTRTRSQV